MGMRNVVRLPLIAILIAGFSASLLLTRNPCSGGCPSIEVTGSFSPANKVDVYPTAVNFTNTMTGQKFSAAVATGQYSVMLPNHSSYHVTVVWAIAPGIRTGSSDAGVLNLDATAQAYTFDIKW